MIVPISEIIDGNENTVTVRIAATGKPAVLPRWYYDRKHRQKVDIGFIPRAVVLPDWLGGKIFEISQKHG